MDRFALTTRVKAEALRLGFDLVGVTLAQPAPHLEFYEKWLDRGYGATMDYLRDHLTLKQHPDQLLEGVSSVVAVALNYNQPNPPTVSGARIAKYALGRDYHKVLRKKLSRLGVWLEQETGAKSRACVDSAPIFEREFAHLAGLGWFGKNTMLINSQRGSWFFLGLLLTTADLQPDAPTVGGCGSCRRCIDACPTGAIVFEDERWQVNSGRCISYLTIEHRGEFTDEQAQSIGEWTYGCDVCQEVCPFNTPRLSQPLRAPTTHEPDFLNLRSFPGLVELAQITDEAWDELSRGSAMRRAGSAGMRRNARANLKNLRSANQAGIAARLEDTTESKSEA